MQRLIPVPRLLPATIVAMALLLGIKSVALVRAAAPSGESGAAPAAVATEAPKPAKPAAPAQRTAAVAPQAAPPPSEPPISAGERALLLDLRQRRAELDARAAALTARESVLAAAEARLDARVKELGDLQKRLESLEAARNEREEANWRGLVKLYESMKPRDAGTIFNDLDLPVLLPILDRMKAAKAAAILAAMEPERARLATAELADRRTRANAVPPAASAAGTPPPAKSAGGG
jgi:flagellar motility protein MotE (MotC chaperone)